MRVLRTALTILAIATAMGQALAQAPYPARPIRMIVPFPSGQSSDILARVISEHLQRALGQAVVVDNRAGAGAIIGMEAAARAEPDGYTLVTASSGPMAINPSIYPQLPYDPRRQFAAITNIASIPQVLVVSSESRFASVEELVSAAKASPGKLSYGSAGKGTTQHLTMEMFRGRLGLDVVHVPYKGAPPATTDLIGGHIGVLFDSIPSVLPFIKSGKLRALAVSSAQRSPFLPDVPTVSETVAPGFNAVAWIGLAAPAGTPQSILRKLNATILQSLQQPDVKEKFAQLAFVPVGDSPEHFQGFIRSEIDTWAKVVKDSGIKLD